jgi:hypothetical protein
MRKIVIPYPINVKSSEEKLYVNKDSYSVSELSVEERKDVFVSHEGLCLKNGLLVPNSHFNLTGKEDYTFYWSFYKIAIEQYLVSTYGKSLTRESLVDEKYLLIYTKWFGYFFGLLIVCLS